LKEISYIHAEGMRRRTQAWPIALIDETMPVCDAPHSTVFSRNRLKYAGSRGPRRQYHFNDRCKGAAEDHGNRW